MDRTFKNELYEKAAAKGFTKEEVDRLANLVNIMASKVVKEFLLEYVIAVGKAEGLALTHVRGEDGGVGVGDSVDGAAATTTPGQKRPNKAREVLYRKLVSKISKVPVCDHTGSQEINFKARDGTEYRVRYMPAVVPKNHEILLHIPPTDNSDEIVRTLLTYLDNMIKMCHQYYCRFIQQSRIVTDLAEFLPEMNVAQMQINTNHRTLFLDSEYEKRIGVMCFYIDKNGAIVGIERPMAGEELAEARQEAGPAPDTV